MTEKEDVKEKEEEKDQEKDQKSGSSAETEKTGKDREGYIPRDRFDEVNQQAKDLQEKLDQIERDQKKATEERLAKQDKWKELAENRGKELDEAKVKADRLDSYEETLQGVLDAQVDQVPEELRTLIPDELTTQQKLDWLAQNQAILTKKQPFDIGAGKRGGDKEKQIELSNEERAQAKKMGLSPEEYAQAK